MVASSVGASTNPNPIFGKGPIEEEPFVVFFRGV